MSSGGKFHRALARCSERTGRSGRSSSFEKLRHPPSNLERRFVSIGAAGWHICFDVRDRFLEGHTIGALSLPRR